MTFMGEAVEAVSSSRRVVRSVRAARPAEARPSFGLGRFAVALVAFAAGCGGGGSGAAEVGPGTGGAPPPSGSGSGGTGGSQVAPTAVGDRYGELEVVLPQAETFLLRGTLPLPPDTFPRTDGQNPFAVLDYDGSAKAAQVEVVSWYPSIANQGAEVVEIIARVRRNPALAPGTRTTYPVVVGYTPYVPRPATASIQDLIDVPVNVSNNAVGLFGDPTSIEIATRDVFGHRYSMRPLEAQGGIEFRRYGDLHTQVRTYGTLLPDSPQGGSTGTLPHMMGVHAYISSLSSEQVVLLDLRFNNGPDAHDAGDPIDDNIGDAYWDELELIVPSGWMVLQAFDDPYWGGSTPAIVGSDKIYELVEPMPGSQLHVMPWQSQFHRRLALCPVGFQERALAILEMEGLGFCRRGNDPGSGDPYLSWWNTSSARFFPQSFMLPSLEHVGHSSIRSQITSDFNQQLAILANGTGTGSYPYHAPVLGWAHPYGVPYGGMTGGNEIQVWDGIEVAETASVDGYRQFQLTHRMHTDRMPDVLYGKDGEPTRVPDWLEGSGASQYVDFSFFLVLGSGGDPFGSKNPPTFQSGAVAAQGRQPSYESTLKSFDPHDQQHLIRYTRSPKVLAWLGNDALAKDDLEMQAEVMRLSYHQYFNSSGGYMQGTGLLWDRDYVDQHPAAGFRFGRQEGWSIDCVNAAYSLGDEEFRSSFKPWYDYLRDVIVDGQAACSGFLQANIAGKFLSGQYRARQAIEQAIAENAIRGMVQTVYFQDDATSTTMLEDVLEKSYYSWFNVMSWDLSQNGPWAKAAVGPLDESLPPWCNQVLTSAMKTPNVDTYQLWSSMAYANNMTSDPIFYQRSIDMLGGSGSLLGLLQAQGTSNIGNRAALLALVQIQNGVF